MGISAKIGGYISQSSWIRKMFEEGVRMRELYGADRVFDFSLGNPNVEPPPVFDKELRRLVQEGKPGSHGYMPNAGYPETRAAVAAYLSGVHGVSLTAGQVVMTCGAGGGLNVILKTLLDPGDEVLVPAPYFVEYGFYADNAGGRMVPVPTAKDFSLDLDAIAAAVSEKTKVILINSPNNPTGRVYGQASIDGLSGIIEEKNRSLGKSIYLVSDEPYGDIVYDGVRVPSILAACKSSILVSSYSKSLSLPGERIGYVALNPDLPDLSQVTDGAILCNRILGFVNAPALMQRAIAGLQGITVDIGEYRRKRDLLCAGLEAQGYRFARPEGAFYLFVQSPIADDVEFVRVLQKHRILTVPGRGFGAPGYFRIAYCVDDATIVNALPGFGEAIREQAQ